MKSNFKYRYKKKELIWKFARSWKYYSTERITSKDHDFPSESDSKVIPLWLYDIQKNKWLMILNTTHDTSELNCNAIETRRNEKWKKEYKEAKEIVIFADW